MDYRNSDFTALTNTQSISQLNSRIRDLENKLMRMENMISKKMELKEYTFKATFGEMIKPDQPYYFHLVDKYNNEYEHAVVCFHKTIASINTDISVETFMDIYKSDGPIIIKWNNGSYTVKHNMKYKCESNTSQSIIFSSFTYLDMVNSETYTVNLTYDSNKGTIIITLYDACISSFLDNLVNNTGEFTIKYT